jgi:hypothetical protein
MIDPLSKWMYKRSGPLAGSLTFLGLSMAWFSAFMYVCVQNGVSSMEMPSRLFALGSVYGMQRPTLEVAWQTTCAGLFGMLALGVCDLLYVRKTKARWFGLHTIANMWISVLCLPDCWFLVSDPITALTTKTSNHWPTALVFSVHVYHVAFFRNLVSPDPDPNPSPNPSPSPSPSPNSNPTSNPHQVLHRLAAPRPDGGGGRAAAHHGRDGPADELQQLLHVRPPRRPGLRDALRGQFGLGSRLGSRLRLGLRLRLGSELRDALRGLTLTPFLTLTLTLTQAPTPTLSLPRPRSSTRGCRRCTRSGSIG